MSGAYIVVLRNAVDSENRLCAAYVGGSGRFDTTDAAKAQRFSMRLEAEERANHWRGWWRGFHGGADIAVIEVAA